VFYNEFMPIPILATKLYSPAPRPNAVIRSRLIERLNEGLLAGRKLTLISAPAGFGKTTLVSEWIATLTPSPLPMGVRQGVRVAWLSLDEGDNDPVRFLAYLVAAMQTIAPDIGAGTMAALQSPQPPPGELLLTDLLNEITTLADNFMLVLDDYHVVEAQAVDEALTFLVEHLPRQLHLVIASREDPPLPLARLRVRDQLTELRAADLCFTTAEAAEFLNRMMGLNLSAENIAALEQRTEGWIAGLQLAAISLQGHQDAARFIQSFTGSHHFVLDYLIEEVLHQQPESVQTFLLYTSILDRLCGSLCEAVVLDPAAAGQATLEYLERANLFIVPLDNQRQWYRYHHLFGDLLRQRLGQVLASRAMAELHIRASQWYEDHGMGVEAFQHAAAANDIDRAERLMVDKGMPLHFRGVVNAILEWLAALPKSVLDARPALRVRSATMALMAGQSTGVEERLQAAEATLQNAELTDQTRNLIGQIACARATLALTRYAPEMMLIQAQRALEYLPPDNLTFRFTANWILSNAYLFQGDRAAADRALTEALAISQASGDRFSTILALDGLGLIQELENQLDRAAETYRHVLHLESDQPHPNTAETHLGLARIYYEWNDLATAEQHGQQSLQLARQYDRVIDRFIISEVFLARLKLAQGDVNGAAAVLAAADRAARQQNFAQRLPEIAAVQVLTLLREGDAAAADHLAQTYDLPISRARVYLAQGESSAALALLEPLRRQMEAKGWQDERLKVLVLQAVALYLQGEKDQAIRVLNEALTLAEPGGFVRLFVDEGEPMRLLLQRMKAEGGRMNEYAGKLLAAFGQPSMAADFQPSAVTPALRAGASVPQSLIEPLSQRELEILKLIAEGLSNREISSRLFLALDTVKGHNRRIFEKLQVKSRTEAIARARELGWV
jgi:LuxR family transcriptional regulator, maltose regulon positive regulatory protein